MLLRIVADDLTGALDTAAPFVALAGPLPVYWDPVPAAAAAGSFALDTESREIDAPGSAWLAAFDDADLAYKKIDSLLRGNTTHEIAACLASGRFESALIAPAFPAQQRITKGGLQYWRADPEAPWQAVAADLDAGLSKSGVSLRLARSPSEVAGRGCFLCDATSEDDLQGLVTAGRRLAGPVLWCGSAGLARALAGASRRAVTPPLAPPLLLVIGSHHPVTLAQVEALAAHAPEVVIRMPADARDPGPALRAVGEGLARHARAALVIGMAHGTGPAVAGPIFDRVLGRASALLPRPRSLVVTGGATLHRLAKALAADALLVTGEPAPGVPAARLQGGRWDGCAVISKSGAFGDARLLIRLADSAKGGSHD